MNSEKRLISAGRAAAIAVLLALLPALSCNWGVPDYTLTVVVEEGVTGTPATGEHKYQELTLVSLDYSPVNPQHTVEAILNNQLKIPAKGTFTMYGDQYELVARLVDIRGDWTITLAYSDTSVTAPEPFTISLQGPDLLSGTFTDSRPEGYYGTWSAINDVLTIAYSNWDFYLLIGGVYDLGGSAGTFTGGGLSGTWTAVRTTSSTIR